MDFYLDTADINQIKEIDEWGILRGVTTNPSIIAKTGRDYKDAVSEVLSIMGNRHVSVETLKDDAEIIVEQGKKYREWGNNVVVKVATTEEGLKALSKLRKLGIPTNATLIFSLNQGILAAEAGANYISPFVGRLDDIGSDGIGLVEDCVNYVEENGLDCKIISASLRSPQHLEESAKVGAHIATCPCSLLKKALKHPLNDIGLKAFLNDWEEAKKKLGK